MLLELSSALTLKASIVEKTVKCSRNFLGLTGRKPVVAGHSKSEFIHFLQLSNLSSEFILTDVKRDTARSGTIYLRHFWFVG